MFSIDCSKGVLDPTMAKAVVIQDGSGNHVCIVSIDAIGADGNLMHLAYVYASAMGFPIPEESVVFGASHTHSGPGGVSESFLWQVAPAVDLLVPELQQKMARSLAAAMMNAYHNMKPAKMNIGIAQLLGVTVNRRAGLSPYVNRDSIDPNLGVIRIDDLTGAPMLTLWNFAIHGVCYGPGNMYTSSDIMGKANQLIESQVGGISMFINADAGDIDPSGPSCQGAPNFVGSNKIAQAVIAARSSLVPSTNVQVASFSHYVDFGPAQLNATLARFANCTSGGPLDVCTFCRLVGCELNPPLGGAWLENVPRFTALKFLIGGTSTVLVTMPGEPLLELGWWVRNDTLDAGYAQTLVAGYSNNHMGYFAPPNEYVVGGYESQLTFWGIDTAINVRNGVRAAMNGLYGETKN
jgi:neutral ceramidase